MDGGLQELQRRLQESRAGLLAAIEAVPEPAWGRKPDGGGWSPIEVLEHVALVEEAIAVVVEGLLRQGEADPACRRAGDTPRTWEALPLRALAGQKLESPAATRPQGGKSVEELRTTLSRSRLRLEAGLNRMGPLDTDRLVLPHPLGPELNVCQWLGLAASHEVRHTRQMRAATEW